VGTKALPNLTVHYVGIESKAYGVELNFHLVFDATCQFRTPILIK
jgi:hypothetical protein